MNSADLYNATEFDGEYITYYRTKTKDRRNDNAKMIVRVHPIIQPLVNKYKGKERVFNFYERFFFYGRPQSSHQYRAKKRLDTK